MKSRRSVEILFAGFLVFLGLSAFIPPVDASWLFERFGGFSTEPEDLAVLARTTRALATCPPGWLAIGLEAAAAGKTWIALGAAGLMLVVAALAWLFGLVLLKRFYRGGRGIRLLPSPKPQVSGSLGLRLPGVSDSTSAAFGKECRVLFSNPKARLLFAVPFFLLILLKLIGAPQLFRYLWADAWAAMLLSLLGLYILSVLSGQFFGNGFGYDGSAVLQTYLSPAPIGNWLAGRNLAQGLFGTAQFLGLFGLLFLLVPDAGLRGIAIPACSFPFGLLTMLSVGNLLSARFPRRFHDTLARRDRPVGASFVIVMVILGACTLLTLMLMNLAGGRESLLWLVLAPLPLIGALLYRLLFPLALGWTRHNRERIIAEIARPV
jgi:ABC-2 type transport system permease protein